MADYNKTPRKKSILSEPKNRLVCKTLVEGKYYTSTLSFDVFNNHPEITVWINHPDTKDDPKRNKISLNLTALDAQTIFETLKSIANGDITNTVTVESSTNFVGGSRVETPVVTHKVTMGRDGDGVIYISCWSKENRQYKLIFKLLPSGYHFAETVTADGQKKSIPLSVQSDTMARGYAGMMSSWVLNLLADKYEYIPPKDKSGQSGQRSTQNVEHVEDDMLF